MARVLLVSDDPAVGRTVTDALAGADLTLARETSATAAIEHAARERPAVILADLAIPEFHQRDVMAALAGREAPVLVLGNAGDGAALARAMDAGASGLVPTPLDPRVLRAAVQRVLRALDTPAGDALPPDVRYPPMSLAEAERRQIARALRVHHGNRTHAARALGVARATLIKKIKLYQLD